MSSFGFRPHFSHRVEGSPDTARESLVRALRHRAKDFEIKSFPGFVCLRLPEVDRHFWSPRLNLSFEADESGQTRVEGVYGPNANLWSLFVYGYLIIGSAALFGGCLGFAQHALGKSAWGLWIFWSSLALGVALWLMAQLGQKLGAHQTYRLHQLFESALGQTEELH
jgi:hypothetical protein